MAMNQVSFVGALVFCFMLSFCLDQAGSYMGVECPILDAVVKGNLQEVRDGDVMWWMPLMRIASAIE